MNIRHIATATCIALCGQLFILPNTHAALNTGKAVPICATAKVAEKVQRFYRENPAGAPLPIAGRALKVPEVHIATGVAKAQRVGIAATPEIVKQVWASLESWGEQTLVRLVFTMGGSHVLDFPSLMPVAQEDLNDGWIDIYADDGKGVHGHLWLDRIASIHAVDLPGQDDVRTRAVSFYAADGTLAMGVYASISTKEFDRAAVDGFAKTWSLLASMPQVCP